MASPPLRFDGGAVAAFVAEISARMAALLAPHEGFILSPPALAEACTALFERSTDCAVAVSRLCIDLQHDDKVGAFAGAFNQLLSALAEQASDAADMVFALAKLGHIPAAASALQSTQLLVARSGAVQLQQMAAVTSILLNEVTSDQRGGGANLFV